MSKNLTKKSSANPSEETEIAEPRKLYIEFAIEGLIIAEEAEANSIETKLYSMFNKILKDNRSVRINNQVSKYYEDELILSLFQQGELDKYEN